MPPTDDEADRQRLEPDLLALSLLHGEPGATARVLERRRGATVAVRGAGRVGGTLTGLLTAAGVRHVASVDAGALRAADLAPGGLRELTTDSRGAAVAAGFGTSDRSPATTPVLEVVAPASATPAPEVLHAVRRAPHLLVTVRETTASVGPFVVPGRTPCLRCQQLDRADRDPDWPVLAAQLAGARRTVEACDITLATLAAALAAMQVLAWIDSGGEPPAATAGAVLDFELGELRLRRRTLARHPACGCDAGD